MTPEEEEEFEQDIFSGADSQVIFDKWTARINATAVQVIDQHIPSLTDEDEFEMMEIVGHWFDSEDGVEDLARRTCHCGVKIDGYYAYIDHLKEELKKAGIP